jgi:uncharacterized protein
MAKLKPFSEELIIQRIRLENPWWETNEVPQEFITQQVAQPLQRATVLIGPRRVGKTVMLFHLIQHLLATGTSSKKICYLSIDAPVYNNIALEELFALCRKALGVTSTDDFFVVFDEIQYLKQWEQHLKTMVDFYRKTRFIVSGSAAAALKLKGNESGAGRFSNFMLPPLTFQEYLHLKQLDHLIQPFSVPWGKESITIKGSPADWQTLNRHFIDYINYGGYPEIIFSPQMQADPGRFVRSDIIEKVLLRDLPSLYGITDVQELNSLFNVIAYNSGNIVSLEGLSQESGVKKQTLKKYLEYLEAAFLIKTLYPVQFNTKRFIRAAQFKIYLTNPSMRCALFAPIQSHNEHFGQMVETAIVAQWLHRGNVPLHYASWNGGEVDLVMVNPQQKPWWMVEVKFSNQYTTQTGKLKSLIKYAGENKLDKALVTTIDIVSQVQVKETFISFCPAAAYCYSVGWNSLENRRAELLGVQ